MRIESRRLIRVLLLIVILIGTNSNTSALTNDGITTGAEQIGNYLPLLKDKRVAIVANHTAVVNGEHLVDLLLRMDVDVRIVFAPEHGFRGDADAGAHVVSYTDKRTGVEVVSIYGKNKKPDPKVVAKVDVVLFDIQDVGLRFYTYLSSMHYVMESCAEAGVLFVVLDRPNPNGREVDGPILEKKHRSFVGMHPIPILHGMTLGELAKMINGEGWLKDAVQCKLTVIPCVDFDFNSRYVPPIAPSPNLPNIRSIYLYPTLCLFEGTILSVGRGTDFPFQVYGHPSLKGGINYDFSFTPTDRSGAVNPVLEGQLCWGEDLRSEPDDAFVIVRGVNLKYIVDAYRAIGGGAKFFKPIFKLLTGVDYIQEMIIQGKSAVDIEMRWRDDVQNFYNQREPYLIYKDLPKD